MIIIKNIHFKKRNISLHNPILRKVYVNVYCLKYTNLRFVTLIQNWFENLPDTRGHSNGGEIPATEFNVVVIQQEELSGIHWITNLPWVLHIYRGSQL